MAPVLILNPSPKSCGALPLPDVLNIYLPGFAFVSAMKSLTVFAGTSALMAIMAGISDTPPICVNPFIASYGSFL